MPAGGTVLRITPVPEPATYAMLLAGIGALTWVARRRRA
ncbi:MAG: FxDxF family PEP-CTERM protein [Burkholderiaceae bacterium]|nr:FxDxF family PEP-CTERM protein [Burkholderiaceae bacterium]